MRLRGLAAVGLVSLAAAGACSPSPSRADTPPADPPSRVEQAICRPAFEIDGQTLQAGTAFAVARDGQGPLLVTALHLFGPSGGLESDIPWAEMPAHVQGAACQALAGGRIWSAGPALAVPDAAPMSQGVVLRDVAAFPLLALGVTPLKLAKVAASVGDRVWLVSEVPAGAPRSQLTHAATVVSAQDEGLQYRFDNPALQLRATSGAPIVNADGDVVGINLGGARRGSYMVGIGDSLPSIVSALGEAHPP